jgi:mono/diheme cytochrome c family protein
MQTILKVAAFLSFCAIVFVFAASGAAHAYLPLTDDRTAESVSSPRSLYIQNCARCHGADGRAETRLGKKLEAADLTSDDIKSMSTAKITRAITNGRADMPAFRRKLTRQQIAQVADYVRSL